MDHKTDSYLQLPIMVIGRIDVGRLLREIEALNNFMAAAAIREPGTSIKPPKTSRLFDEIIEINSLNVLLETDRARLLDFLQTVYKEAPLMHISFGADPSPLFMQRLMTWMRQNIHTLVLVQIGLQPNIGAGCVIRTNNKYFDLSLRTRFLESRDKLAVALRGESKPDVPETSVTAVPTAGAAA